MSEIEIRDEQGTLRDWPWLVANFGEVVIHPAIEDQPGWRVVRLQAQVGPAAIIVKVEDQDGNPVAGLPVGWYWPDADPDPNCGPLNGQPLGMIPNICDLPVGLTNGEGIIGHPMGGGAWYHPTDPGWPDTGPHCTWVYGAQTNSDLVAWLGMIALTDHRHINITYRWSPAGPPPPPPGDCPWPEILAQVYAIEGNVTAIEADCAQTRAALQAIRDLAEQRGVSL